MRGDWLTVSRLALARRAAAPLCRSHQVSAGTSVLKRCPRTIASIAWLLVAVLVVQPTLALANTYAAASLPISPMPALRLASFELPGERASDALWNSFASSTDRDDDEALNFLFGLVPRRCVLTANPPNPIIGSTFTLAMSACTRNPTSYVWTGPNIAPGTTTIGPSLEVTAPTTPQVVQYSAEAKRGRVPSAPVVVNVNVVAPSPPSFNAFDAAPRAVAIGQSVTITYTASGHTSTQYFYGQQQVALQGSSGNTYTLPSPGGEGVYQLRVRLSNAGGSTERGVLVAVTSAPAADARSAPVGTSNVGSLAGTFAVSDSGAATYSIPIQVPPGTAGMQPALAFSYNSHAGNGLLGVGWSLSGLSTIHRCPSTIVQDGRRAGINYDNRLDNDKFCLDGQRLVQVDVLATFPAGHAQAGQPQIVEYRTEIDTFSKIVGYVEYPEIFLSPTRFQVWTKSGQIMGFGSRFWIQSLGWNQGQTTRTPRVNSIADSNRGQLLVLASVKERIIKSGAQGIEFREVGRLN